MRNEAATRSVRAPSRCWTRSQQSACAITRTRDVIRFWMHVGSRHAEAAVAAELRDVLATGWREARGVLAEEFGFLPDAFDAVNDREGLALVFAKHDSHVWKRALADVAPSRTHPQGATERTDDGAEAWLRAFIIATRPTHCAAERAHKKGHRHMVVFRRAPSDVEVQRHLSGTGRLALFPFREDRMLRVFGLLVRPRDEPPPVALRSRRLESLGAARRLIDAAKSLGAPATLFAHPPCGFTLWWILDAPVDGVAVHTWLRRLITTERLGPAGLVARPLPDCERPARGLGPRLVAPLWAVAGKGGRPRSAVDPSSGDALKGPTWVESPAEAIAPGLDPVINEAAPVRTGDRPTDDVLAGCAVLAALANKARGIGRLETQEYRTVLEALGPIQTESNTGLQSIVGPAGYRPGRVRRDRGALGAHPVGCRKIRHRHSELCERVSCNCAFVGVRPGTYATPSLHTRTVNQLFTGRADVRTGSSRGATLMRGTNGDGSNAAPANRRCSSNGETPTDPPADKVAAREHAATEPAAALLGVRAAAPSRPPACSTAAWARFADDLAAALQRLSSTLRSE